MQACLVLNRREHNQAHTGPVIVRQNSLIRCPLMAEKSAFRFHKRAIVKACE
jgi:hypothetical protein